MLHVFDMVTPSNLYVHLDDSLPNQRSSKECPEGDQEVTTGDACQVKQRVGDLREK